MGLLQSLWQKLRRKRELSDEDRESRRIAQLWAGSVTPEEREVAVAEVIKFVVRDSAPSEQAELTVLKNPGAHEAHLIRRYQNPYFQIDRQTITQADILDARKIDEQEYEKAAKRFDALMIRVSELPDDVTIGDMQPLREEIENLTEFCLSVDGRAKALATQADKLRDVLLNSMREALLDDSQSLGAMETASAYHDEVIRPMHIPIVAQIRKDAIPIEDIIPTLVSEEPAIIEIILNSLPDDTTVGIRVEALKLLLKTSEEGYRDPAYAEKATVLMRGLDGN